MAAEDMEAYLNGIQLLMNNSFVEAETSLGSTVEPSPRVILLHAQIAFCRGVLTVGSMECEEAIERCWKADAAANAATGSGTLMGRVAKFWSSDESVSSKELDMQLVKADAHLMAALMQLILGRYVRGAWNIRAGYNLYTSAAETQAVDPEAVSAPLACIIDFGIGMFNLVISLLPSSYLTMAEMVGFSGKRDEAIRLLTRSYESGQFWAPFPALLLLYFYTQLCPNIGIFKPEYAAAAEVVLQSEVAKKNSKSALFMWMAGGTERLKRNGTMALELLQQAEKSSTEFPSLQNIIRNDLAWCRIRELDWKGGSTDFGRLLQSSNAVESPYNAVYAYETGICLGAAGDLEAAMELIAGVELFLESEAGEAKKEEYGPERYAREMAKALTHEQTSKEEFEMAALELIVLWDQWETMSEESADKAVKLLENQADGARTRLLKGALQLASSKQETRNAGLSDLRQVETLEDDSLPASCPANGEHYKAFAQYILGKELKKSGETSSIEEGNQLLQEVRSRGETQPFHLYNILSFRLHATQD